jgi:DNA-binding transcriptional regulator YhcF (GntR family)
MPREVVTSEEIQRAVYQRILSQQYQVGERLPSVRALAIELRANRNTVNRAYQLLAEMGVIEIPNHGRDGFRVKRNVPTDSAGEGLRDYFYDASQKLVWQGFAAGLTSEEVSKQLTKALETVYGMGDVSVAFFECNPHDSKDMGGYLSKVLQRDIYCGLIDELLPNTTKIGETYDLVITTFHHLSEVMQTLKKYADKVIGIDTRLAPGTMLEIARLPKGKVGVVSTLASTAKMLQHILYSYYPDWRIEIVTTEEPKDVKALARSCDHLLVTHTCLEQVKKLTRRTFDVVIEFQVDQQSVQFLDKRIRDLQVSKTRVIHDSSTSIGLSKSKLQFTNSQLS